MAMVESGDFDEDGNPIYVDDGTDNSGGNPAPGPSPDGTFGNNGGSVGDNITGTDGSTVDNGPPNAQDIATYKQQLIEGGMTPAQADQHVNQVLSNVAGAHPEWAGIVQGLAGAGVKLPPPQAGAGGTPPLGTSGAPTGTTPGGSTPGTTNSLSTYAPAVISAIQGFAQSNDYKKWASEAADKADPFGPQRGQYQTQLANLYADPSSVENTPGYKFALAQGLGATANRDNNKFGIGAGSTSVDMQNYAQGLASQTFNQERNSLMQLSGANASPGNAGSVYASGMNASALAQTGAMGALSPLFQAAATPVTNPGTTPVLTPDHTVDDVNSHVVDGTLPAGSSTSGGNTQPTAPVNTDPTVTTDIGNTVPNNNTGVAPGGT